MVDVKKIVIRPVSILRSMFEHDTEEFLLENDIVEEYNVYYEDNLFGRFWVSNNYEDSVQFYIPIDRNIVEYIFKEMDIRSLKNFEKLC